MLNSLTTIVAYFVSWGIYGRKFFVSDIDCTKLTHVNYAFANIVNGSVVLGDRYADIEHTLGGEPWIDGALQGNFRDMFKLKERCRSVKTCISIGGWTWSKYFSDIAATKEKRETFVSSALDFVEMYGFDCVDIDWEYPVSGGLPTNSYSPMDTQNYLLLVQEFQRQIALIDYMKIWLTIAAPCESGKLKNYDLKGMAKYLDHVSFMCYDFSGPWSPLTDHQSNFSLREGQNLGMISVMNAINSIKSQIPAKKIIIGYPFYGRSFLKATKLLSTFSGDASGSWENGVWDYKSIPKNCKKRWEPQSKAEYCVQPNERRLITYDSPTALSYKLDWSRKNNFGGSMFWEASSDIKPISNVSSLQRQLAKWTLDSTPKNNLCYPNSIYPSLKVNCSPEKRHTNHVSFDYFNNSDIANLALMDTQKVLEDPLNEKYLLYPRAHYNYTMFADLEKH